MLIELRSDGLYYPPGNAPSSPRSRLCEQVWLDQDLFGLAGEGQIYAVDASQYTKLSSALVTNTERLGPGIFGEQLVIQDVNWAEVSPCHIWQVADAKLAVVAIIRLHTPWGNIPAVELNIAEEGLVEPGAIIVCIS